MLKKFTPIIQDEPILFKEDVYLFTDSGKVLSGRQGREPIKNIFSLVDKEEQRFVYENMFFAGLQPLLLVDSSIGPIFIDDSLFGTFRLLIAILPHFSRDEILAVVKDKIKSIVLASPKMKKELEWDYKIKFDETHNDFAERLLTTHRGIYYYRVHGRTNGELSLLLSEIAYDYSHFCGCEFEFNSYGAGLFEMKNNLCVESYIFALTSLLFTARNYSKRGRAKIDVFFDEMGIYFEFGFEIAEEYRSMNLIYDAPEVKNFKTWSTNRLFECEFYQNERAFAVRGYPWYKHPTSADLKEERKEFIYNI